MNVCWPLTTVSQAVECAVVVCTLVMLASSLSDAEARTSASHPGESWQTNAERSPATAEAVPLTFVLPDVGDYPPTLYAAVLMTDDSTRQKWEEVDRKLVRITRGRIVLVGKPGRIVLVTLRMPGKAWYWLCGPIQWPGHPVTQIVDRALRTTITGHLPSGFTVDRFAWLPVGDERAAVPHCWSQARSAWTCIGLPMGIAGVVLALDEDSMASVTIIGRSAADSPASDMERVGWGRLLRVRAPWMVQAADSRIEASAWRAAPSSAGSRMRVRLEQSQGIVITRVTPSAFWISGSHPPNAEDLIQLDAPGAATLRAALMSLASGPPEVPADLDLADEAALFGRVQSDSGQPAAGAMVTVSEIIPSVHDRDKPESYRPFAEGQTDAEGGLLIRGVGLDAYELRVMHRTMGRARRVVRAADSPVVIRLQRPREVRGRVVHDGRPVEATPILVMPDPAELSIAPDPLDHLSLEAQSDVDGRFRVALPPQGHSELRIGNERTGFVRRRLGPAQDLPAVTELGDMDLGAGPRLTLVLDGFDACRVQAIGPIGSAGLHIVPVAPIGPGLRTAQLPEAGRWTLMVMCGDEEIAPVPPFVDLPQHGEEVTLTVSVTPR